MPHLLNGEDKFIVLMSGKLPTQRQPWEVDMTRRNCMVLHVSLDSQGFWIILSHTSTLPLLPFGKTNIIATLQLITKQGMQMMKLHFSSEGQVKAIVVHESIENLKNKCLETFFLI